jgi:hypothetical protein
VVSCATAGTAVSVIISEVNSIPRSELGMYIFIRISVVESAVARVSTEPSHSTSDKQKKNDSGHT